MLRVEECRQRWEGDARNCDVGNGDPEIPNTAVDTAPRGLELNEVMHQALRNGGGGGSYANLPNLRDPAGSGVQKLPEHPTLRQ